jgi:cytochrome c-type biogenesis protein CcsB
MAELSHYAFLAGLFTIALAFLLHVTSAINSRSQLTFAGSVPLATSTTMVDSGTSARYASILTVNAFVFLTASLLLRTVVSRHAPFSNMFEFSLAFSWGALGLSIYFENRYRLHMLTLLVIPIVVGLLAYATTVPDSVQPLAPALQNNLLLTAHVTMAILAYGAFTVAFAAGVLYLVQRKNGVRWLPRNVVLDEVGYRAVLIGFPMLALAIVLGAVWADIAWGSYWTWDPKETAALGSWLIYGGYLHARVLRGWRGDRSALLLIGGFGATLFCFYGNLFFGGMHSYA